MEKKATTLQRLLRLEPGVTLSWWLYERISSAWPFIGSLIAGGAMTYLASISAWVDPWGPVGWGATGIGTACFLFLAFTGAGALWAHWGYKAEMVTISRKSKNPSMLNPLNEEFSRERINLEELFHPFMEWHTKKTFKNCEFFGPGIVILNGYTHLPRVKIRACDFVIVTADKNIHSGVGFTDCSFIDCSFFRVTFLLTAELARSLKEQIQETGKTDGGEYPYVISDGTFGKI